MEDLLTDAEWAAIRPHLPPRPRFGRPRADDRRVVAAILWVLRNEAPWCALPPPYGDPVTAWRRHRAWRAAGVWPRIERALAQVSFGVEAGPAIPWEGLDSGAGAADLVSSSLGGSWLDGLGG